MTRYRINQYGEVFEARPVARRARNQDRPAIAAYFWQRHWAWFGPLGPWGKLFAIVLLWPLVLVLTAAAVLATLAVAIVIGIIMLINWMAER